MDETRPGYAHAPVVEAPPPPVWFGPWAHQARPLGWLGALAAVLLVAQAALALASAVVAGRSVLTYAGTSGLTVQDAITPSATAVRLSLLTTGLMVVTGVVFMAWLFRATRNLELHGVRPRRGPGWAIGSWFVPVISLWWPKQMVDDVLRGSRPDVPPGMDIRWLPKSGVVTVWWLAWLMSGLLASLGASVVAVEVVKAQLAAPYGDVSAQLSTLDVAGLLETQGLWTMWAGIASCLAALCAAGIVFRVTSDQGLRHEAAQSPEGWNAMSGTFR